MKTQGMMFLLVVIPVLFLSGCAGKYENSVSANGLPEAEQALSVPHPVEYEKSGEQYIAVFPLILSPELWGTEGFSSKHVSGGVWPVVSSNSNDSLGKKGYAFITEMNFWGDNIMQGIIVGRKAEIGKIMYLSRDGHTAQSVSGEELDYDSEKFDKDPSYQVRVFSQSGSSIQEVEDFWRKYSRSRGLEIPANFQFVEEIKVGSPRWEKFKADLATRLSENYKMPNGEIRSGYMSLEDFRKEASKNNGTTAGQRFGRSAVIPATIEPISLGIGTVGSLLNGLINASNGPMEGFYSMAECRRGDLKSRFKEMSDNFKLLLMQRDQIIYELQSQYSGGTP
ncbi:MAG: hypothetical protein GX765_02650 [Candidatus Moranbacteria bacterium]|nr:hypothetical protein [Candidatus Moranbacteria bacterium]